MRTAFPKVEMLIHLDPEGHVDTDNPLVEADVTPHWFGKRLDETALRPDRRLCRRAVHRQSGGGDAARRLARRRGAAGDRGREQSVAKPPSSVARCERRRRDFELRWFTPAVEVALCGHATLASGHFVLSRDPDARPRRASARARPACSRWRATATAMRWRCRPGRRRPSRCPRSSPALGVDSAGRDAVARRRLWR